MWHSETELGNASEHESVARLVIELAAEDFQGPELDLLDVLMGALRDPANNDPLEVFDKMAVHGHDASFQIGVVSYVSLVLVLLRSAIPS